MTQPFPTPDPRGVPSVETLQAMRSVAIRFNEHLNAANEAYLSLQELARSEEMAPSVGSELGLDWDFMELVMSGLSLEEAMVRSYQGRGREGEVS